ncbi:MAG: flagellar hook-length control protein FliK [Desulfovibrio sp.]|jgi:flagellar hook-length control protein FliK|nr:flagellar hook-length control protein FliK [Desulfovibrio sp.]
MQILPIDGQNDYTAPISRQVSNPPVSEEDQGFSGILGSFIEEGREDYSGRPAGFAAYGQPQGPVDSNELDLVKKELEKRGVAKDSLERLEQLAASNRPLSASAIFGVLSGRSRAGAALTDEEGAALKNLLQKFGFNKDEQDEMLALSDAGNSTDMWKGLSKKLDESGLENGVNAAELAALLKGLDLSKDAASALKAAFNKDPGAAYNGAALKSLLAPAMKEISDRELAQSRAGKEMRAALSAALDRARLEQRSAPVADTRGSRAAEQSEILMQKSVREKAGIDALLEGRDDAGTKADKKTGADKKADADKKAGGQGNESSGQLKAAADKVLAGEKEAENKGSGKGDRDTGARNNAQDAFARTTTSETRTQTQNHAAATKSEVLFPNVVVDATVSSPLQFAPQSPVQNSAANAQAYRSEIFAQVEAGLLQGARQGMQRLTLQLNPAELGGITVVLRFHDGELRAGIRAERADSAEVLSQQLAELKSSLEEAGIKVAELDVQTSLAGNDFAGNGGNGAEHNLMSDAQERDRVLRLSRLWREEGEDAHTAERGASAPWQTKEGGLHLVA